MAFQGNWLSKTLVIGIIILFIGISAFPTVSNSIRNNNGISLITIKVAGEMGLNDWYVSDVGFTFTNESYDIAEIKYRIDGYNWQTYTEPFYISEDGKDIHLEWYAVDFEGNQSEVDGPFLLKIDQTPPETELSYEAIGGNPEHGWDVLVTMNATDAMSGMDRAEFYLNDVLQETVVGPGPLYQWTFKYDGVLVIEIGAKAFDKAGNFDYLVDHGIEVHSCNVPQLHSSNIRKNSSIDDCLDDVLSSETGERENDRIIEKPLSDDLTNEVFDPAYVIVVFNREMGENGWIVSNVSIPIYYESDRIDEVYYQIDEEGWMLYSEPLVISDDGEHCFSWYAVDSEGFASTPESISFKVDMTPPEINLKRERIAIDKVKIIANVYDETSNIDRVEFIQGSPYHYPDFIDYDFPFEWIWDVFIPVHMTAIVYDNAGNSALKERNIFSKQINQQSLSLLFLRLIDRFPLLGVFLRAMNLLR